MLDSLYEVLFFLVLEAELEQNKSIDDDAGNRV
jgi:hypothetical protein